MLLKGENIILRAPEPRDIDVLYNWENDTENWKVSNTITPFSRYVIEQYILNSHESIFKTGQLRLMIVLTSKKGGCPVGAIDLFDFDPVNKRAGIGILIEKNSRNKGYAREALELLIDYCFAILGLHQLFCNIGTDNPDSLKLFRKAGFLPAGIKKDWIHYAGTWQDEYFLQLINTD